MSDTRERILQTALRLFARDGFEAVSMGDIAGALGITKGALYRHYQGKRDIFDCILARMARQDAEQAEASGLPEGTAEQMPDAYRAAAAEQIAAFSKAMFRYWTEDAFASQFRRMLTLEQYRSPEMSALYQQYLAAGPMGYVADLLAAHGAPHPEETAAAFYGPMFLLYSAYDGASDKQSVLALMDALLDGALKELLGGIKP